MSQFRWLPCVLAWISLWFPSRVSAQGDPAETVQRYRQAVDGYRNISAHVTVQNYAIHTLNEEDTSLPQDRLDSLYDIRFWRNGDSCRAIQAYTRRTMQRGKLVERTEISESKVGSDWLITAGRAPGTQRIEGVLNAKRASSPNICVRNALSETGLALFDGAMDFLGPRLCDQLARAADLRFLQESLEGRSLVRIDFDDDWGSHSVWLDPQRGYHPIRITQRKSGSKLLGPDMPLDQSPKYPKTGRITSIDMELNVNKLRPVGHAWFAEDFVVKTKTVTESSSFIDHHQVVKVKQISRDSGTDGQTFALQTTIPDGTRVAVEGEDPVRYEWRAGAIVKSINQPAVDSLAGQRYHLGGKWWLWPSGALVVAIAALILVRLLRKRRMAS